MSATRAGIARSVAIIPVYGENKNIKEVLTRFQPGTVDEVFIIADAATSNTLSEIRETATGAGV